MLLKCGSLQIKRPLKVWPWKNPEGTWTNMPTQKADEPAFNWSPLGYIQVAFAFQEEPFPLLTAVFKHCCRTPSQSTHLQRAASTQEPQHCVRPTPPPSSPEAHHTDEAAWPSLPPGCWDGQGETGLGKTVTSRKGNSLSPWCLMSLELPLDYPYLQEVARGKGSRQISGWQPHLDQQTGSL